MALSIGRWRPKHLLAAWGVYWVGLAGVTLASPIRALMHMADGPRGSGAAAATLELSELRLTIAEHGATTWTGSTSLLALMLWVTVPPLLLWIVWLATRSRPVATAPAELGAPDPLADLERKPAPASRTPQQR